MLAKELVAEISKLPPDARIYIYLDQDVRLDCDQWSGKVYAHISDYYHIAEAEETSETVGCGDKYPCLVLTMGKAVQ